MDDFEPKHHTHKHYTVPFNIKPFRKATYLKEDAARSAMAAGLVGIILPVLFILSELDPWANMYFNLKKIDFFYRYSVFILIIVSAFIAYKQWGYYYWEEDGGKKGIFKCKVQQVNALERELDIILAVTGALLFAFAELPVYWFLALAVYSILALLRCCFTLMRKHFADYLKNRDVDVPDWYTKALDEEWNHFPVKKVLAGWIATHYFIYFYSLIVFVIFESNFDNMIPIKRFEFLVIALMGVLFLFYSLSKKSYDLGSKICSWLGV